MDGRGTEESSERVRILAILEEEDIRFMDGRYSAGFVDARTLHDLVIEGLADMIRPPVGQQRAFLAVVTKRKEE